MSDKLDIHEPAQADERKEPLPWNSPKSADEDPECPHKIQAIIESPSYVPAIEDVDFLNSDDARGVRLQLDFLKPDRLLKENGVQHTIVVFGSTRIVEPLATGNKVEKLRESLAGLPNPKDQIKTLA